MSTTIFPDSESKWYLSITAPTVQSYHTDDESGVIIKDNYAITASTSITTDTVFDIYCSFSDGMSIANDKMLILNVKFSPLPSQFTTCNLFIEDESGERQTYGLTRSDLGKMARFDIQSCSDNTDFNNSYVSKIGFHFETPTADTAFKFTLTSLDLSSVPIPIYADPQETIRFLGLIETEKSTGKAHPFILRYDSYPSYEYICDLLTQAESYIDEQTRMCWREKRAVNEIHNSPQTSTLGYGFPAGWPAYADGVTAGDNYIKGYPITLNNQYLRPFDATKGDKLEVRVMGTTWSEVPAGNIWMDHTKGIVWVRQWFFQREDSVRVTYRYGLESVPEDVNMCAKIFACRHIISTDWYRTNFPQSPDFSPEKSDTVKQWNKQIADILKNYQNDFSTGFL